MRIVILFLCSLLLAACSREDLTPSSCTVTVVFNNVAIISGNMYATQDYPLTIESVECHSNDANIVETIYSVDSKDKQVSYYSPFKMRMDTRQLDLGTHVLAIFFNTDNNLTVDNFQYTFTLVPTVKDLQKGAELGTYTHRFKAILN